MVPVTAAHDAYYSVITAPSPAYTSYTDLFYISSSASPFIPRHKLALTYTCDSSSDAYPSRTSRPMGIVFGGRGKDKAVFINIYHLTDATRPSDTNVYILRTGPITKPTTSATVAGFGFRVDP